MRQQWKTISKAFKDMNKDIHTEGISPNELKFYLTHWGLALTESKFKEIYAMFDIDKDGKISYTDFNQAIGNEIHPGETLYFRQEKYREDKNMQNKCIEAHCCSDAVGSSKFCNLHDLVNMDEVKKVYKRILAKAGDSRWNDFKNEIKKHANSDDDYHLIEMKKFVDILKRMFNMQLTPGEKKLFINVCGKTVLNVVYIDVSYIH